MSVVEATERGQINFSLEKRPTLAHKIEEAAQRLGTTPSALCRDVVETFLDAHIEWTRLGIIADHDVPPRPITVRLGDEPVVARDDTTGCHTGGNGDRGHDDRCPRGPAPCHVRSDHGDRTHS